ncbi:uncharacterized protein LOC126825423 [Patella vulgata]|uniref:uncharacterized protein LOC126825423 n=1 Tax=Patella vulgata TaxID=6465 RepID=UPI00217F4966|nr:uncharacterized protein LOC126825423 [Patella vulgata]
MCHVCYSSSTNSRVTTTFGTLIKVVSECNFCGHIYNWTSQPFIGTIPAANLMMSCAILFSGSLPTQSLRLFDFMNINHISSSTYMEHQKFYLYPAVTENWQDFQDTYIQRKRGSTIVVGGDGRADTPGHCAKYGSYCMMDLDENKIITVELIQSNEVKSSVHMEKEGLIRCVDWLKTYNIDIGTFVSDRHLQIQKWVRENLDGTNHFYDVWHVSKGLKKKMASLSKEKECEDVGLWTKSIINHLYWSAGSTEDGDGNVMWAKWESICNHVQNVRGA